MLRYLSRFWLCLVTAACLPSLPAASSFAPAVQEAGGLVVMEAESAAARGGWALRTAIDGFTGTGYQVNTARNNGGGVDILDYPFLIATAGTYQLQVRNRIAEGNNRTESNDAFVRLVDAGGAAVTPVANGNEETGGWFKIYMNTVGEWTWQTSNKDHAPRPLAWTLAAGQGYRLQLSRRSQGHAVDRIVLWDRASHSLSDAKGKTTATQADTLTGFPASTPIGGATAKPRR